jgi:hypothetical protein
MRLIVTQGTRSGTPLGADLPSARMGANKRVMQDHAITGGRETIDTDVAIRKLGRTSIELRKKFAAVAERSFGSGTATIRGVEMLRGFRLLLIEKFFDKALNQPCILRSSYLHSVFLLAGTLLERPIQPVASGARFRNLNRLSGSGIEVFGGDRLRHRACLLAGFLG